MKLISILLTLLFATSSFASEHLIVTQSKHSVSQTADRFVSEVKAKGLRLFTRVDHSANAAGVELELPPTELILFGNPKVGTKLMHCAPTVAIDLPQKVLVWQDPEAKVWLAYSNPLFLKQVHAIEGCDQIIEKVTGLLAGLAASATSSD